MNVLLSYYLVVYIISIVFAYFFARKMVKENADDPDFRDVLVVFVPLLNSLLALFYVGDIIVAIVSGKIGKNFAKKFFMIK
ncbi:hypothetical protein [Bacillus infantis]|uniref:hypothetical protein n=1 Tax=Bacillus infantis TaxID=324767 RepID=UPI00209D11C6|nr:hypothetical protein [Bacillus infantis]MCP1159314.1 hypothetical protein [Bacillus infantis]